MSTAVHEVTRQSLTAMPTTEVPPVETVPSKPAKGKGGAPRGNKNHLQHGAYSFVVGRCPKSAESVQRQVNELRRDLYAAVTAAFGKASIPQESIIRVAIREEKRSLLFWLAATKIINANGGVLSDKSEAYIELASVAAAASDRAIARLKLPEDRPVTGGNPWDALHQQQQARQHASAARTDPEVIHSSEGPTEAHSVASVTGSLAPASELQQGDV